MLYYCFYDKWALLEPREPRLIYAIFSWRFILALLQFDLYNLF